MAIITVEIDDAVYAAALARAQAEHTTLAAVILRLLEEYAKDHRQPNVDVEEALAFLDELDYVQMGDRRPTRDEMNER